MMMDEKLILKGLTTNIQFAQKVIPFLKRDYFSDKSSQALYTIVDSYYRKYGACASPEVMRLEIEKINGISQEMYDSTKLLVTEIINADQIVAEQAWLVTQAEEFVKERALYNALAKALSIAQGDEKKLTTTAIPQILSEALSIDFDSNLGHDYIENAQDQIDFYNSSVARVPTGIECIDDITNGGFPRKTLNTLLLGTHVGKTLLMTNIAANAYLRGANVLYITLEESENKIRQRIDSNLLDIDMDDLIGIKADVYLRQLNRIKSKVKSRLIVKEYPTASASAMTFKALLAELKLKENFVPDIICVDYLGICLSDRSSGGENSNTTLKYISEELRGLAQWCEAALVTGQQLNRGGATDNSNPGMGGVADSFGSLFVADFVLIGVAPDELRAKKMMMFIQEKNRHRNINYRKKFIVGVDTDNMRIYDIDDPGMQNMPHIDDIDMSEVPVMDQTPLGKRLNDTSNRFGDLK